VHPQRLLAATANDLYRTNNGGRSWTRIETGGFDTRQLRFVKVDPNNHNRLVAASWTTLWQSVDFGTSWVALTTVHNTIDLDWGGPELRDLFVTTDKQLLRLVREPGSKATAAGQNAYQQRIQAEPAMWQTLSRAVDELDLAADRHEQARDRARLARWLPQLGVAFGYRHMVGTASYPSLFTSYWFIYLRRTGEFSIPYATLLLSWDIAGALFQRDELGLDRINGEVTLARERITEELVLLYEERRRQLYELLVLTPADAGERAHLRLRVEELTARLAGATGDLWLGPLEWIENQE
jgi:hypothetical protein